MYPILPVKLSMQNSQAVKRGCSPQNPGQKSCEIKDGSKEMVLMLLNFKNAHSHYIIVRHQDQGN